jgi:hypothetical protein
VLTDGDERMLVALVAGATRGAGRAAGPSEIGRPETIEETGDLIGAAGGGAARVVDHEDPSRVAAIDEECGRLDVLVNDIFGATGTCSGTSRCGSTTCSDAAPCPRLGEKSANHGTSERGGVGLGQAFHDARTVPFRRRFAEVDGPQLGHELRPQLRTAGGQQFGSDP